MTTTLHDHVLRSTGTRGDHPALVDAVTGSVTTYAELGASVRALAGALHARGLVKGDVVALFAPNCPAFPVAFLAASRAGLTVTPVNALATSADVARQLRDSGAKLLITVEAFLDRAAPAARATGAGLLLCESIPELVGEGHPAPAIAFDPASDVAVLPYSSGTTGTPKGVVLTHRSVVANLGQMQAYLTHTPEDVLLAVLPFSHIYGMQVLMNLGLASGATVVTMPRFELGAYLAALSSYRVTRAYVAPPIVVALAKSPLVDEFDLSSLQVVLSAAAPLDGAIARLASTRLGVPVTQGCGMTELSGASHLVPFGECGKPGSIGRLVPGTEARLVDPQTGADTSGRGELWLHGPQVMVGYLNRPDATAETVDAEGWLHTGDIATVDADGDWFIVDRVKELIKFRGYQVAPAELEAELLTSPDIADAAVVGAQVGGEEVPRAFVVRAPHAPGLTADDVIAYVGARVAPYKRVRAVEFVEAIPKAPSGKLLRRELRCRVAG
ncbi:MAG TPA: AMP-binding protein [Nocardioides sp.]|nr:AMP-binding protein [Nocardioides sp.]